MIHSFLNGIDDGLKYSQQTLLIFTNIKYITVSDEFNVLTGYTAYFTCGVCVCVQYIHITRQSDAVSEVCALELDGDCSD